MAGEVAEHGNEKTRKGWKKSDGRRLIGGGGGVGASAAQGTREEKAEYSWGQSLATTAFFDAN